MRQLRKSEDGKSMDEFISGLLGAVFGGAVLSFFMKSIFQQILSKDLEVYKAKLQKENATAVEKLKADLRIEGFRRERLHETRIELIGQVYASLLNAGEALNLLAKSEGEGWKEVHERAEVAVNEFGKTVGQGAPFITQALVTDLRELHMVLSQASFSLKRRFQGMNPELTKEWVVENVNERLTPRLRSLEEEVRVLIGAEERDTNR